MESSLHLGHWLINLRVLRLGSNQLYGEIPVELLGSLIPLEELDLSDNGFQVTCYFDF